MDRTEYIRILEAERNRLFSLAFYQLRDREDAEDAVQEALLRLWRHRDELQPDRAPFWLTRVLHNLCIDQARKRQTVRRHLGRPDSLAQDRLPAESRDGTDPERDLGLSLRQAALLAALADLPPESQSVMTMHYFQGLKLQEIAGILDAKVSTLKVRIHRARKTLRKVLETPEPIMNARRETG